MWEFIKANPFILGALTGSLAAYVLGLIVNHLRREKRWLGYSVSSRNIVQKGHTKLEIKYAGRDIQRLDSHSAHVRNIGNRALKALPIHVDAGTACIVDHEVNAPDGAHYETLLESEHRLTVTVDLLNPGEAFTVGLTVSNSESGDVNVSARGEYLEVRNIGERASTQDLLDVLLPRLPLGGLLKDLYSLLLIRR